MTSTSCAQCFWNFPLTLNTTQRKWLTLTNRNVFFMEDNLSTQSPSALVMQHMLDREKLIKALGSTSSVWHWLADTSQLPDKHFEYWSNYWLQEWGWYFALLCCWLLLLPWLKVWVILNVPLLTTNPEIIFWVLSQGKNMKLIFEFLSQIPVSTAFWFTIKTQMISIFR